MFDSEKVVENLKQNFGLNLDPRLEAAAGEMQRSRFVSRIYDDRREQWVTNNDRARWDDLLSEDRFVPIQTEGSQVTSSISQPSLVFAMTQLLDLKPGHRVLEIGAASGWSAALMSELVGAEGEIVSVEIDVELASLARANLAANRITNVKVVEGDGLHAISGERPFDRIVYTVGARDFPASLLDLLGTDGRVVLVHKFDATADILYKGRKVGERLELEPVIPVIFVELRGALEGADVYQEVGAAVAGPHSQPFWGDASGYTDLLYRTAGFRFYLRMRTPDYQLLRHGEQTGFGLWGEECAVALKGSHVVRGSIAGVNRFQRLLNDWAGLGMPGLTAFRLTISRPGDGHESAYYYQGRDLCYEYMPILPAHSVHGDTSANILPLRAAGN